MFKFVREAQVTSKEKNRNSTEMSVIVRRCVFNKCLDLARNNSRSIVIGDGQVNKSLNDCRRASTVCSRQALSLPIGSYANTAASTNCTSIRFYSYKRGGKGSGSKHDDRDSDEVCVSFLSLYSNDRFTKKPSFYSGYRRRNGSVQRAGYER